METRLTHVSIEELTSWLCDLVRINTTNPPGNETLAISYLTDILDRDGLKPKLYGKSDSRMNLYLRIPGNDPRVRVLLTAHLDVVPVEGDSWDHPPFAGEVIEDVVWGRGTHDCKGLIVMIFGAVLELLRSNRDLDHTIAILFLADEEENGEFGAHYLVNQHPELFDVDLIINEGGGMIVPAEGRHHILVNNAEKGTFQGEIIVTGEQGHASIPRTVENVLTDTFRTYEFLTSHKTAINPSKDVVDFIVELSGSNLTRHIFKSNRILDFILDHPPGFLKDQAPFIDAMVRPTITPTILNVGTKINVIPGRAYLQLDCRLLPGQDWGSIAREIDNALAGKGIEYELRQMNSMYAVPGNRSDLSNEFRQVIEEVVGKYLGEVKVLPFQVMGSTDMRFFRHYIGTPSFGFMPVLISSNISDYSDMIHGRNERISVQNLIFGTVILRDLVLELDTKKSLKT